MSRTRVIVEARQKARSLRHQMTKAEVLLWLELRELKSSGLHFRKQAPIVPYIVDFVCHSSKLIVEVDGDLHESELAKRHDANRDAYLKSPGYRVLRVDEPDVRANPWHVAQMVKEMAAAFHQRPHPAASRPPSPQGGGIAPRPS